MNGIMIDVKASEKALLKFMNESKISDSGLS